MSSFGQWVDYLSEKMKRNYYFGYNSQQTDKDRFKKIFF